ncbi:MAG: glycoside hydrolase family 2 protein [Bacteroidota bacterium]|nr:glycoside hydrolase family 2 protein [Bacteroidota bacterium]
MKIFNAFRVACLCVVCCLFSNLPSYAQLQWPTITPTAKPWTRWWWQGSAVNENDISMLLKKYRAAGLGGLEVTPIYGVKGYENAFINYLSPRWMDVFTFTLREAKKNELGIDMATGTGWPFGGPTVQPADACKNINLLVYALNGGDSLRQPITFTQQPLVRTESTITPDIKTLSYPIATNKDLQLYAFDQVRFEQVLPLQLLMGYSDTGDTLDLTGKVDKDGILRWVGPAGTHWQLYALFQGLHGKMVERAAPGGEGDAIDHFSAAALHHYLQHFDSAFAGRDIGPLRSFFNDSYEVDDARGQSNWTPGFLEAFRQRRGYDCRTVLPALFQKDNPEMNARVLYDYRLTISDLLLENFTRPWHAWAKTKGKLVRNQSHGSPANILDLYAAVDIPETEGEDLLRFKFATSAAHVTGKPLASAESATWLNEHFLSTLGEVKQSIDQYFLGGVNHVFYHGTNYSPPNEAWPGWLFYAAVHFTTANPFWRDFPTLNQYIARTQSFLQEGRSDNDLLVYFPFCDKISEPGKEMLHHFDGMKGFEGTLFNKLSDSLLKAGYAFDFISDAQLMQLQSRDKQLYSGKSPYRTIVIPSAQYMPLQVFRRLLQLADSGASIVFYGQLPRSVPGWAHYVQDQQKLTAAKESLVFQAKGDLQIANRGEGRVILANQFRPALAATSVLREGMVDEGLQFVRRKRKDGYCYFISNRHDSLFDGYIQTATGWTSAALFDPMDGTAGLTPTGSRNKKGKIRIKLLPGQSVIIQTSNRPLSGQPFKIWSDAGSTKAIEGKWELRFINGGPVLPAARALGQPVAWTDLGADDEKRFAGTAVYSVKFRKPAGQYLQWRLNLGGVGESVEVRLNGRSLGTLLGPAFQLLLPGKLQQNNKLEFYVTNGMANRIADLDRRGVVWKKFYNTNFPARFAKNRGADGLFSAAAWPPVKSGLWGPVTLTPVHLIP